MKIEIDTKHDSHDEIKKVISMLQHLVGETNTYSNNTETKPVNIFDDPNSFKTSSEEETTSETTTNNNLFGMFGSTEAQVSNSEEPVIEEESKDDIPDIMTY